MTEFVNETHEQGHHNKAMHYAMARLSASYEQNNIHEMYANLTPKQVSIHQLRCPPVGGNQTFILTIDEVSAFVEAWMQFKANITAWEQAEQERKEQETLQEAKRYAHIWREVDQLIHSVPGLELIKKEDLRYHYETDAYELGDIWDVKLLALASSRNHLENADEVLDAVKDLTSIYHQHLELCEEAKTKNWYGWNETMREEGSAFLAAHRAFLDNKEEKEEKPATE